MINLFYMLRSFYREFLGKTIDFVIYYIKMKPLFLFSIIFVISSIISLFLDFNEIFDLKFKIIILIISILSIIVEIYKFFESLIKYRKCDILNDFTNLKFKNIKIPNFKK